MIEKSVTDKQICNRQTERRTNRQTDRHIHESVYRVAPQLKMHSQCTVHVLTEHKKWDQHSQD